MFLNYCLRAGGLLFQWSHISCGIMLEDTPNLILKVVKSELSTKLNVFERFIFLLCDHQKMGFVPSDNLSLLRDSTVVNEGTND